MLKNRGLSFKIILLFLLTGVAMIIVLRFTSGGNSFIQQFQKTVRPHLYHYTQYINDEIGTPPNLETAKQLSEKLNITIIINGPDLHWSSNDKFPQRPLIKFRSQPSSYKNFTSGHYKNKFALKLSNPPYQTTFITQDDSKFSSPWKLIVNTLLGILLVLGLLYFLLSRMISPLKTIQKSVKRIGSGELDHRINIKRQDELGKLSQEINAMADDVENMLEAKRQLLLAISHELRSPITRAKVAISLMDDKQSKLKEGLEGDLNEMQVMISGLLEAEQLNHRHQTLNLNDIEISPLISNVITKHFPNDAIKQELDDHTLLLDEARFQFVIKNLIDNALKHRKGKDDEIKVNSTVTNKEWIFTVEDSGKGISKDHLPHLTEPFYRVDPSRHRETGGYGLGLYIIKMIVEAHRGELLIESEEGLGTKATIKISI